MIGVRHPLTKTPIKNGIPSVADPQIATYPLPEMPDSRHRNRLRTRWWQGGGAGAESPNPLRRRLQARLWWPLEVG